MPDDFLEVHVVLRRSVASRLALWRSRLVVALVPLALSIVGPTGISGRQDVQAEDKGSSTSAKNRPLWSRAYDTVENRALSRQRYQDLRRISLGQASLFHRRLVEIFARALPKDLKVRYEGPLALETGQRSQRIEDQGLSHALNWAVEKDRVVFAFWVSTARTNTTAAECEIEGKTLFLNIDFIDENRSVDEKRPELGGRSPKEVLKLLERACAQEEGKRKKPKAERKRNPSQSNRERHAATGSYHVPEDKDLRQIRRQIRRDQRRISIGLASRFHRHLVDSLDDKLPQELGCLYAGPLASDLGRGSTGEPDLRAGMVPTWKIVRYKFSQFTIPRPDAAEMREPPRVIFSFWISTQRTSQTAARVTIDGRMLYLNPGLIENGSNIDDKLPALGRRSVQDVLRLIEQECAHEQEPDAESRQQCGAKARNAASIPPGSPQFDRPINHNSLHELIHLIEHSKREEKCKAVHKVKLAAERRQGR